MKIMKIAIAGDHAGFELKEYIKEQLDTYDWLDLGPDSTKSVDYPDFAHPLAKEAASDNVDFGILICGSANGVAITANKHQNIRAAICWMPQIATLAKQHNNANVICLPARFIAKEFAVEIVLAYLNAEFEGGRHANRVSKISC